MLEERSAKILLCLVLTVGLSATWAMGADILFVTVDPTDPEDAVIKGFLEGLGHTVTYIDDNADEASTEAATAAADLVYISESVSSGQIREEITEIETPMIICEAWAWDEMGLTSGGGGGIEVASPEITIVNPGHFLAAGLSGAVPVLTSIGQAEIARFGTGLAGTGATVIATATLSDGQTYDVLFVYDKGAPLAVAPTDGSPAVAADTRICMFFDERSIPLLNANAYELLAAAVHYALGMTDQVRNPSPADRAENVSPSRLQWSAGQAAMWHTIYLGTDPALGADDLLSERQTNTTYDLTTPLQTGSTYYWRVEEIEADGTTVHIGPVWSFSVALLAASAPQPSDGAIYLDPGITLRWTAGHGAVTHDVYLGTDETAVIGATRLSPEFKGGQSDTTYDPSPLAKGVTYFWRVDEVEADGAAVHRGEVWRFSTLPNIPIDDPNLIGWWKLDDERTGIVTDYSGHDHHGTLVGDLQWVEGFDGDALAFDGASYVDLPVGLIGTDKGSVTVWIKTTQAERGMIFYGSEGSSGDGFGSQNEFHVNMRDGGPVRFFIEGGDAADMNVRTAAVNDDTWHHIAATWDIDGDVTLYVDGANPVSAAHNGANFELIGAIRLGSPVSNQRYYVGLMDDVRLYDYVLSVEEIAKTMMGDPKLASAPGPENRSTVDIEHANMLTWTAGENATGHHIYFGADRDAVARADSTDTSGIYRGPQDLGDASYDLPDALEFGGTYYWRVDELTAAGTIAAGRVWSFTVADYLVVDDFEDYSNLSPFRPFQTWIDGFGYSQDEFLPEHPGNNTGAAVGHDIWTLESLHYQGDIMENAIVYAGDQSLPLYYDNTGADGKLMYSEMERTWAAAQDWTRHGVKSVVVHFRGYPAAFVEAGPGNITLSAAGADIYNAADECRLVYKRLSGNGTIVARVDRIDNTDPWAKGGVMIRADLGPGSRFAAVYITPGNGCRFQARPVTNGLAVSDTDVATTEQMAVNAPYWIKLERAGDQFSGYYSEDPGMGWTTMSWNPQTITMAGTVYVGLVLTSHSPGNTCTAEFSGVTATGGVSGQWQVAEIGIDHPDNSPGQLYVALADSAGRVAVVDHPDGPGAAQFGDWTAWTTDLAEFANRGVDLTGIKRMMVGVGDRVNPSPGESGLLFIDEIRLQRSSSPTDN